MAALTLIVGAVATAFLIYPFVRRIVWSWALSKYTCVPDLDRIGEARKGEKLRGTAVVCGGSVTGLLAARICSDHFERVVVVEPEAWTFTEEAREPANFDTREVKSSTATYNSVNHKRSRVYQYAAVHLYQVLLLRFARKLFPGFDAIAKQWNMLILPSNPNASVNGYMIRLPESLSRTFMALYGPRRTLEPLLRKLICESRPGIEFVHGTVTGFGLGVNGSVQTVSVRHPDNTTRDITDCALAIDCTGIAQSGLKLLSRAIPTLPSDLRASYNADICYATLEYPMPPNFRKDVGALNIPQYNAEVASGVFAYSPSPEVDTRMVVLTYNDANSVVLTMGGWAVDMPVTLDEVRAFARGVKSQDHIPDYFYKALDLLEPVEHLGTVFEARISNCYKVDYERAAAQLPRNFVAMGDSTMRVNPRFGQGVNKGAIGAITLDGLLREKTPADRSFSGEFFKRMGARTQSIWDSTRFADYAAPTTTPLPGETHDTGSFTRWFGAQSIKLVSRDETAAEALFMNMNFLAPAFNLFSPYVLSRIFMQVVREGF
ncbi:hypothetical protein AURDEDRAFT_188101 [Auricularia subglabra TFB-10046 SS5]|uniref:FAD/NAD(P)-binding domain-containing protein n=1 Tax=Auricularia subglabra (strain TFB-10046 / SS5) TaxID=717982 RepID=J0WUA3_AURST|nr:hypothetical protein AURDEDRAFT_188101 [Auricularia subglabra TFB-10046 SS5]